ncbi:MAG: tetratricopeptide repeat protein [Pyrinomonadaceae bacterium]
MSAVPTSAQTNGARTTSDTIIILPFENTSDLATYNWVGESFAEALTDLFGRLEARGAGGLRVISNDERKITQQKLRLPLTTLPSLATSIKLAQQSKATLLVLGRYNVTPAQGEVATNLRVTARVVRVQDGAFVGEILRDGRTVMREIDLADAISKLQTLQGQVAHQILYQREGNSLSLSQNEVVEMSKRVPSQAFEAYVKGMLTPDGIMTANNEPARANFFKNALRLYAEEKTDEVYPQAALELGHFYLGQNNFQAAEEYFSKLKPNDPYYPEAAFYAGMMQWNLNNKELALQTFQQLANFTKLTAAYNNLGAISLQTAQQNKTEKKNDLLEDGLKYLAEAAKSAPDDTIAKFNYGYALFAAQRYKEATEVLRETVTQDPRDGQAYFLLAKTLEKTGDLQAATEQDNQARRYLSTYAKNQTEWQKAQTTGDIPFRLYKTFNRLDYLNLTRQKDMPQLASGENELQNKLQKARELYQAGRDDEALSELRQFLVKDSMNAEAYLLIGKIHLRRGDTEAAVSNLKTAIFWKNDLIEGHIALAKIFLERGDFNQATTYAKNALQLDQNNQEAIALVRQIERRTK